MAFSEFIDTVHLIERYQAAAVATTILSPGETRGVAFYLAEACSVIGADVYTAISGVHSLKLTLWRPSTSGGTPVNIVATTKTVSVSGPTRVRILFDSPFVVTVDMFSAGIISDISYKTYWHLGVYETSGTKITTTTQDSLMGDNEPQSEYAIINLASTRKADGDNCPDSSATEHSLINPLVIISDSTYLPTIFNNYFGGFQPISDKYVTGSDLTVGHFLRILQPVTIYGFKFFLPGTDWDSIKLRFGVCRDFGLTLAEKTVSYTGPGFYTVMLDTPYIYTSSLLTSTGIDHGYLRPHFVSMYCSGVVTPGFPSVSNDSFGNSISLEPFSCREYLVSRYTRYETGDQLLSSGSPDVNIRIPLDLIVGRRDR
jgi:hypothetical protein